MRIHEVFNQVEVLSGDNAYASDVGLQGLLHTLAPDLIDADLRQLGARYCVT